MPQIPASEFIAMAALGLKPNEFWCVVHPEGPLEETASKDVTHPIRVCCEALHLDWDELTDQGFRLGIIAR